MQQQQQLQPETRHEGHTCRLSEIIFVILWVHANYSRVTCGSTSTKGTSLLQQRDAALDSDHETTLAAFLFPLEAEEEEKKEMKEWAHMAADPNIPVAALG